MLAQVREAKFLAQEQQEALTTLNRHLAAAKADTFNATEAVGELEQQAQVQQAQEQHLLDELSRSQVRPLPPDLHDPRHPCPLPACCDTCALVPQLTTKARLVCITYSFQHLLQNNRTKDGGPCS